MSATNLRINLERITENYQMFVDAAKTGSTSSEIAAVVKADAYGLGVGPVAETLCKVGCETYFVAHGFEGQVLRSFAPKAKIYVFHGALPGEEAIFQENRLIPVVHSFSTLERWRSFAKQSGYCDVALQVDTGMNRLGFQSQEFKLLCREEHFLEGLDIHLIMSHLACGDEIENIKNKQQLDLFNELMNNRPSLLSDVPLSLANSAGTLLGSDYHFDVCRVGIGLYGGNPFTGQANPCSPVVTVETPILQISEIEAGESVSYGGCWVATRPSRIATVGVGYADGYLRATGYKENGNKESGCEGAVAIDGQLATIVGRVTMDLIMIDVTELPTDIVQVGSLVEMMGETVLIDQVADHAQTIGYEILTSLGHRYKRDYIA
ncbi:alanine racemase [Hyphomicrobiales bacterium 4NK60-0047b]